MFSRYLLFDEFANLPIILKLNNRLSNSREKDAEMISKKRWCFESKCLSGHTTSS